MPNKASTLRSRRKALPKLRPFKSKDVHIQQVREAERDDTVQFLNAGRGYPNWVYTTPPEAYATLIRFGIEEARRGLKELPNSRKINTNDGTARRFTEFLDANAEAPGIKLLRETFSLGVNQLKFDADAFVHELAEGIIGDKYPVPGRMLRHCERIVQEYLTKEMCDGRPPTGPYDLFPVEGGTAAMYYMIETLMQNSLLHRGDTIALGAPTYTPYIEIAHREQFGFKVVNVVASTEQRKDGGLGWQYVDSEIDKLANRRVKAFFLANPGNPPSFTMRKSSMQRLVDLVKKKRRDLMIITDDVHGVFVPGFRSVMTELPQNTIGIHSYSKHFSCTGWRLGVVALHEDNIFDKMLANLRPKTRARPEPATAKFIDRMVALNNTAGLSLPQQIQIALFSSFALLDKSRFACGRHQVQPADQPNETLVDYFHLAAADYDNDVRQESIVT